MNTQKQIALIVILFFVFIGGCTAYSIYDLPIRSGTQTTWTKDESIERGALLFANNCRTCHGIKGQGGVGPQLNKDAFKDQDPLVLAANKAMIRTTLYCGRAGSLMPAWLNTNGGALNKIQIEHLINLITAPLEEGLMDEDGEPTSKGWLHAVEFAHNLNHETSVLVGGDTLGMVAKSHGIGVPQLKAANPNVAEQANGFLKKGTKLTIPEGKGFYSYTYTVYNDNETFAKIADNHHVGAVILADLNNLPYVFTHSKGKATFTLVNEAGESITGLLSGQTLALPEGATYTIIAGDTLNSIAGRHGVPATAIQSLNSNLSGLQPTDVLEHERRLSFPGRPTVIVQAGQTIATIAAAHGITPDDVAKSNGIGADAVIKAGDKLDLPTGTRYIIQTGDTIAAVAAAHGIAPDALASANKLNVGDALSTAVVIKLPQVKSYNVKVDSFADIAKTLSNVTEGSLAAANPNVNKDKPRVGTVLALPKDAWGSAPPDAKNPGTACVQHAVPASVFSTLPGVGNATPMAAPTKPAAVSKDVKVEANSNDWTVTADGMKQAANKGAVLVAKDTAVPFSSIAGLHTITINGKKDGDDIKQGGASRSITFNTPGEFKITCDYHPDMLAYIWVE